MGASDEDAEVVYLRAFPFSLASKAKTWLQSYPNKSLNTWEEVEEKFIARFFPPSRFIVQNPPSLLFPKGLTNLSVKCGRDSKLCCEGAQTIILYSIESFKFYPIFT